MLNIMLDRLDVCHISIPTHMPKSYPHGKYNTPVLYFSKCEMKKLNNTIQTIKYIRIGGIDDGPLPKILYKHAGINGAV